MRKTILTLALFLLLLPAGLLLTGCATTGPHGEKSLILIDGTTEARMGLETDKGIRKQYPAVTDTALIAYVHEVGQRLAAHSPRSNLQYRFTVLESDIVNAFAAPGGYIYVTTGLLKAAEDEAELAGVLAHEIGHVCGRHALRAVQNMLGVQLATRLLLGDTEQGLWHQVSSVGASLFTLKNSRDHELEADQFGLRISYEAGYDPEGLVRFLEHLRQLYGDGAHGIEGWLSTHPANDDRIAAARAELAGFDLTGRTLQTNRERFLEATASLRGSGQE